MLQGCSSSDCDSELELMTDFNLYFLSLICTSASWDNREAVSSQGLLRE